MPDAFGLVLLGGLDQAHAQHHALARRELSRLLALVDLARDGLRLLAPRVFVERVRIAEEITYALFERQAAAVCPRFRS